MAKSGRDSNHAELPIPPFWSEARLAIRAASEIRFVIPRQSRIALRELSPVRTLVRPSHAILGQCLVKTNPARSTRLRRSKYRVRCNRESSWHLTDANGPPVQVLVRHHDIFYTGLCFPRDYADPVMSFFVGGMRRTSPTCRSFCKRLPKLAVNVRVSSVRRRRNRDATAATCELCFGYGRACSLRLGLHAETKKKPTNGDIAASNAGRTSARLFRSRRRKGR